MFSSRVFFSFASKVKANGSINPINLRILSKNQSINTYIRHMVTRELPLLPPENPHKAVAYWLFGVSGLVAGIVAVGGITRLTRSGLSMTSWKLTGSLPPMNDEEWEIEFSRYKTFPEWQQRQSMTLGDFKFIYFWEYSHRMMGRFIGVAFALPFTYFAAKRMIPPHLYKKLFLLLGLGGTQGLVGWWMVRSGLDENNEDVKRLKEIRVSPYRLAAHLGMAFLTFSLLLHTAFDALIPTQHTIDIGNKLGQEAVQKLKPIRRIALVSTALVGITALSGAFVAGNDAGRAFNTFPKMGDVWIPEDILSLSPVWRNLFENTATVQFDHRILATLTFGSVTGLFAYAHHSLAGWQGYPAFMKRASIATMILACTQVSLGIATLLHYVPISLGVLHQIGSLALLTSTITLVKTLKVQNFLKLLK